MAAVAAEPTNVRANQSARAEARGASANASASSMV
jgi:hypothetical protein